MPQVFGPTAQVSSISPFPDPLYIADCRPYIVNKLPDISDLMIIQKIINLLVENHVCLKLNSKVYTPSSEDVHFLSRRDKFWAPKTFLNRWCPKIRVVPWNFTVDLLSMDLFLPTTIKITLQKKNTLRRNQKLIFRGLHVSMENFGPNAPQKSNPYGA